MGFPAAWSASAAAATCGAAVAAALGLTGAGFMLLRTPRLATVALAAACRAWPLLPQPRPASMPSASCAHRQLAVLRWCMHGGQLSSRQPCHPPILLDMQTMPATMSATRWTRCSRLRTWSSASCATRCASRWLHAGAVLSSVQHSTACWPRHPHVSCAPPLHRPTCTRPLWAAGRRRWSSCSGVRRLSLLSPLLESEAAAAGTAAASVAPRLRR